MKRKAPDAVSLNIDAVHWHRLPASIRRGLVTAVNMVSAVRKRMQAEVLVSSLPAVQICDPVWTDPARTGFVDGRATLLQHGTRNVFAIELPAPTALSLNEDRIHAVLVHESGHCFYYATRLVGLMDSGVEPLSFNDSRGDVYTDEAADRARLVTPSDWFTEKVADAFSYWNDPRLNSRGDDTYAWLKHLRVEEGSGRFAADHVSIPDDWIEHIRRLRLSKEEREP